MILCFRFGQLPMDQHPFADVVETFFGHSLKPTNEPHTADTLKDILGPVRKERQGAPCEHGRRVRRAVLTKPRSPDDAVAQGKIRPEIGVRKFAAAAAAAAAAITEVSANNHALP